MATNEEIKAQAQQTSPMIKIAGVIWVVAYANILKNVPLRGDSMAFSATPGKGPQVRCPERLERRAR